LRNRIVRIRCWGTVEDCDAQSVNVDWSSMGVPDDTGGELWLLESGVRRRAERASCVRCSTSFLRRLNRQDKLYCSSACAQLARRKRVSAVCEQCGSTFERTAERLGKPRHGFNFCSRECKDAAQRLDGGVAAIRPPHYGSGITNYRGKVDLTLGCWGCGEQRPYVLLVHHIDGDRNNNVASNLEVVCGTCHMLRHLKQVDGQWRYDSYALTPREMIPILAKGNWSHGESNPDLRLAKASSSH
jgi:hypothetical protein